MPRHTQKGNSCSMARLEMKIAKSGMTVSCSQVCTSQMLRRPISVLDRSSRALAHAAGCSQATNSPLTFLGDALRKIFSANHLRTLANIVKKNTNYQFQPIDSRCWRSLDCQTLKRLTFPQACSGLLGCRSGGRFKRRNVSSLPNLIMSSGKA